jgi:hypothetical protein
MAVRAVATDIPPQRGIHQGAVELQWVAGPNREASTPAPTEALVVHLSIDRINDPQEVSTKNCFNYVDGTLNARCHGVKRFPAMAGAPSFAEPGVKDFDACAWYGLLAPRLAQESLKDQVLNRGRSSLAPRRCRATGSRSLHP